MDHLEPSLEDDIRAMLNMTSSRRQSLRWMFAGAAAGLPLMGCGGSDSASSAPDATSAASTTAGASCAVIPAQAGGPYAGDGTNSNVNGVANALLLSGIVRSDIRHSFGGATGVAAGLPLTIKLQLVDVGAGCANLAGAAVYLWHCDRDGQYSMYSNGITGENYLRGVQEAGSGGIATFTSIYPGCYLGRVPHVHFEVYPTLAKSTNAANRIKTSQFTFPLATSNEVYATSGYSASVRNMAAVSFGADNAFSDGTSLQMGSVTGTAAGGYVATLTVGVSL